MCDCKKGTDSYCGACKDQFDGLFGYKFSIDKKEGDGDTSSSDRTPIEKKDRKPLDLEKTAKQASDAGGLIDSLLSGFKKKPASVSKPGEVLPYSPPKKASNWPMIIGLTVAAIVILVVIFKATRK